MTLQKSSSTRDQVSEIVADLKRDLTSSSPKLLIFFASARHPLGELGNALQAAFNGVPTIGCTTAGEIISGQMLKGSVVAMLLDAGHLKDARVELIEDAHKEGAVRDVLTAFGDHFKVRAHDMDPKRYVGLVLMDGLSVAEEKIMAALGEATNVAFVGGSAGDDLAFKETQVFACGRAVARGAAMALLEPVGPFEILKTQSFRTLDKKLVVTKADETTRTVGEFDGKPAAEAYAAAIGVSVAELPARLSRNPLGLMINDEPFVRSAQQIDGAVTFFCQVSEGMELSLLEAGDIVTDTANALERKIGEMGGISGLINFHCILRTQELAKNNQTEAYANIFAKIPMIGFSTYGEAYIGHMNQTSTMLLFK